MNDKNMTALISCFSRAYHFKNNSKRIFCDSLAEKIISKEEYESIALNMANGIQFFNPSFNGTNDDALRWIVDNQLSPSVLGRSAFCEDELLNAVQHGYSEYLIFASGYDTFAYRCNLTNLKVFEIDKKEMIKEKKQRLLNNNITSLNVNYIECDFTDKNFIETILKSNYLPSDLSFSSLLGISYYLTKSDFKNMISKISNIISVKSLICFDYPAYEEGIENKINQELAKGASEEMKSKYSYVEITELLNEYDFSIIKHLDNVEMTTAYFSSYNNSNENKIKAPKGVNYCLAVKK